MLMDFSDISQILNNEIHDLVDHSFLVYEGDQEAIEALEIMGKEHRTVILPFIPTAENLAKWAFEKVNSHIKTSYDNKLKLVSFNVRETPKSWASWNINHRS
jgi:6-pyruvoyltetrahydropterin/6-carboxytetrahydropterin synthase